jgi:2-polyprenyl-3-methyl-5-hydroxy-6-metoxy-1,4-benzoquinol methylase
MIESELKTESICPLCGEKDSTFLFKASEFLFRRRKYDYFRCESCQHVFLNPIPQERHLTDFYIAASQELRRILPEEAKFTAKDLAEGQSEKEKIELLENLGLLQKKGSALDIGFGRGGFLVALSNLGWQCTGVEITDEISLQPDVEGHFELLYGKDAMAKLPEKKYDLITMWHVLEHLPNPTEVLREAQKALHPHGKILVAVPNFDSFSAKLFGKYWYGAAPPWHIHQFTTRTMTIAFTESNLNLVEMKGFGKPEKNVLWIDSFTNVINSLGKSFFYLPLKLLLKVLRKLVHLFIKPIINIEERLGSPSAIVAIGKKNKNFEIF